MTNLGLRELFEVERETHLGTIVNGVQLLLREELDTAVSARLYRAAHSLKGAARLVGEAQIESDSHELEELFKTLEIGSRIGEETQNKLIHIVERLGGRTALAMPCVDVVLDTPPESTPTFHITSQHISEVIRLASELAVLSRRTDSALSNLQSHGVKDCPIPTSILQDSQRSSGIATTLQNLCYAMRLAQLRELTKTLPTLAESFAQQVGKKICFRVLNGNTLVDRDTLRKLEPCLIQLVKNSIDHGIESSDQRRLLGKEETGQIELIAKQFGGVVELEFRDDGCGIDLEEIRRKVVEKGLHEKEAANALSQKELLEFIFLPGFSTRNTVDVLSGRGIGLDIVRATLRSLEGHVSASSEPGKGTTFHLHVPSRIASFRTLLFSCGESTLGVPLAFVRCILSDDTPVAELGGRRVIQLEDEYIPLLSGAKSLKLDEGQKLPASRPIVVLSNGMDCRGIYVDKILGEQEVVVHPLDQRFVTEQRILGTTIGYGDSLVTVLNVEHLLGEPLEEPSHSPQTIEDKATEVEQKVLVVDDSLTVRELERQLLYNSGLPCDVAIDGLDGYERAMSFPYSLIITDIDMPRLNGFELLQRIRAEPRYADVPILVVSYKDRAQDQQRALQLGANAYLSKGSFRDNSFVNIVQKLLNSEGPRHR